MCKSASLSCIASQIPVSNLEFNGQYIWEENDWNNNNSIKKLNQFCILESRLNVIVDTSAGN